MLDRSLARKSVLWVALAAAVLCVSQARPVSAATCTFGSVGTSDFNTAANWTCGVSDHFVPGATSTAIIPAATSTSLSGTVIVSNLLINTNATLTTTGFNISVYNQTTTTGAFIAGGANVSTFGGSWAITGAGSFVPGNGSVVFASSTAVATFITSPTDLTFNNLSVSSTGGVATSTFYIDIFPAPSHVTILGNLDVRAIFQPDQTIFTAVSTTHILSGAALELGPAPYTLAFNGTTTNDGSINTGYGSPETVTFNGDFVNNGQILANALAGTFTIKKGWTDQARSDFSGGNSTFIVSGSSTQSIPTNLTFWNLTSNNTSSTVSMGGNATATNNFTLTAGTFAVGANTFHVPGTFSNGGHVTETSGSIVHPVESILFTDSLSATQSTYTTPATVYVQVADANRNLDATTAETITMPVSVNAGGGSDAETITLTETGVATGIFRSAAVPLVTSSFASTGNSQFEITSTGVGTSAYIDAQDATDASSTTVVLAFASTGSGGNTGGSGGGGGGVGSSGSPSLPPLVTVNQTLLVNLKNLGVPVHALVKLPDDRNLNTQEDSAVYYIGADGMRHAFPNNRVYATWYTDFSQVQIIGSTQLATIPLGKNVTYKPGVRMVKFTTDPKVYAVAKGGILRWVATEAVATSLYGAAWNTNIDDISDAFYGNYSFGPTVSGLSDFNPATVTASVTFPSDSLQM